MAIKDKTRNFFKKFKLDSHHAIERFGIFFGVITLLGLVVTGGAAASAYRTDTQMLNTTSVYNASFTTSKTQLLGTVSGLYSSSDRQRVLVMMSFAPQANVSYNAADYEAFLLGSNANLQTQPVNTAGVRGTFHIFGSTGHMGVLLEADEPFDSQVLNLTMRANRELAVVDETKAGDQLSTDESFLRYDQWRLFINPGAQGVQAIPALDSLVFSPARAYYDIVLAAEEAELRADLDAKLLQLRADQTQIETYTNDLATTKADGLFLRPPKVPVDLAGDVITGVAATEAQDGVSTLALETDYVMPGGLELDWRSGNLYDGYLDSLLAPGQNVTDFLAAKSEEASAGREDGTVSSMSWILSDGTDLVNDYSASDVVLRPLNNVMTNLSKAYQNYERHKREYQSDLSMRMLRLEMSLRDVRTNSTIHEGDAFLKVLR